MSSFRSSPLVLCLLAVACGHAEPPAAARAPAVTTAPPAKESPSVRDSRADTITILHTNDMHSRVDPVAQAGGADVGGVTRRKAEIDRVRHARGDDHVLLFDGGDFSSGTVFYHVWHGSESVMAMNACAYDAVALGNHEFDEGTSGLARMLRGGSVMVGGEARATDPLLAKVVASNLDLSSEPALRDLVAPRAVITRGGARYGIVGAITADVAFELGASVRLLPYVESVQAQIDALATEGIDRVILVSHAGTKVDSANAANISGVDVIVAGHDHALLGDAAQLRAQGLVDVTSRFKGEYPRALRGKDGQPVVLVSANEWGRVLGRVDVTFDEAGHVKDAHGAPIVLAATNDAPDAAFEAKLDALRAPVKSKANEALGATAHALTKATHGQSDLGALFADAMLEATRGRGRDGAVVALAEPDARADLPAGNVTFAQLYEAWPFETPVMLADLSGAELESVVAHGLSLDPPTQIAGITARVTKRDAKGAVRIVDLRVGGKKIALDRRYLVAVDEYVAKGNDDYAGFAAASARGAVHPAGVTVRDAVARALHAHSPVAPKVDGRVVE